MSKSKIKQVIWSDEITIEKAIEYKNALLDAFEKFDEITLSIETVTDIDIAGLQVIFAAQQEAELRHKKFTIEGTIPEVLGQGLKMGGVSLDLFTTGEPFKEKMFTTWNGDNDSTEQQGVADARKN